MPSKKARKPSSPVRYLLSADQRLRKLSLRKVSSGAARKGKARPQATKAATATRSFRVPDDFGMRALVLGAVLCIVAAAALMAARQPSEDAPATAMHAGVGASDSRMEATEAAAAVESTDTSATDRRTTRASAPATVATVPRGPVREEPKLLTAPAPARAATEPASGAGASAKPAADDSPAAVAPASDRTSTGDDPESRVATITGCLKFEEQQYWLTDTSGAEAPKSRSWKSGFLRKRSAPVQLVDANNGLKLWSRVGQRVEASGMLADRELRARSLRQVSASCR